MEVKTFVRDGASVRSANEADCAEALASNGGDQL